MPRCLPRVSWRGLSIAAVLVAAVSVAQALPQHPNVMFGAAPDWIVAVPLGVTRPYDELTQVDGLEHILLDDQVRLGPGPEEHYRRHVYRVLDEKGVRDASQIQIEFDPSYAHVVIHAIAVYRDEVLSSQVAESELRIVEREQGLEALVVDDRQSIVAILDDVRIGDRIELSYTIHGANPVFEGRHASSYGLGWNVPVRRASVRFVLPKERTLHFQLRGNAQQPASTETETTKELHWNLVDAPPLVAESQLPAWFDPYPSVQLSEYADWTAVGRWGLQHYATPTTLSAPLRDKIQEIAAAHADSDARTIAALAFVRDEIRYLSMTLGASSHRPSHPDVVLERRFGDCKDKAVLLVALLDGLGIRARPALVNTVYGAHVADGQPSPLAFDHVIVHLERGGKHYWLDPTALHSRGRIDRISCPRYGMALLLDETSTSMLPIVPAADIVSSQEIQTQIEASAIDRSALIVVETTCRSGSADSLRAQLGENARADLERAYLDFYAQSYSSIRADGPLEVRDDEDENVVTITERYVVPDFWQVSDDGMRQAATITAREIAQYVSVPATTARTMPLGISHPTRVTCRITANLSGDWDLKPLHKDIQTDAVRFKCDIKSAGSEVRLNYLYESLKDSLPPEAAQSHVERVSEILEYTTYEISQPVSSDEPLAGLNWIAILFAVLSFVIAVAGSVALFFYRRGTPGPIEVERGDEELAGIKSWLVLVAIGVVVAPFTHLVGLLDLKTAFDLSTWSILTTPGSEGYHALWAPVLLAELFVNISFGIVSVALAILFFQKRRSFPVLYIVYRAMWAVFLILDSVAVKALPGEDGALFESSDIGSLVSAAVWITYFLKSRRVEHTFVR